MKRLLTVALLVQLPICFADERHSDVAITASGLNSEKCDCQCAYSQNKCDAFKATLPSAEQDDVAPCSASASHGDNAWKIIRGCSHGASDVIRKPIEQLIHLPASAKELHDQTKECNSSTLAKFAIIKPVAHMYDSDMVKIMIEKWSCADIAREINHKIDTVERAIEAKRLRIREDFLNSGKDLSSDDPQIEERLKNEVDEKQRTYLEKKGPPQRQASHWACYTTEAKARYWCEGLINTYLATSAAFGVSKLAATKESAEALKFTESSIEGVQQKSFAATHIPARAKAADIEAKEQAYRQQLKEMGVEAWPTGIPPFVKNLVDDHLMEVEPTPDGEKFYGRIFNVTRLPPAASKASGEAKALTHPEMQSYFEKIKAKGYNLVIDSSAEYAGASAYFNGHARILALRPENTWAVFKHEFQHLEFYDSITKNNLIKKMVSLRQDKLDLAKNLSSADVNAIGLEKLNKIERLIDRGVTPSLAINESLATDEELKALGWKRFVPLTGGLDPYRYKLRHQITELEKLGDYATEQQLKLIKVNKRLHELSKQYDYLPVYGGAGANGVMIYEMFFKRYNHVYYDDKGHVIGKKPNGKYEFVTLDNDN